MSAISYFTSVYREDVSSLLQPLRVFRHPPQRAFPARNAHPVTVRFALNKENSLR